REVAEAHALEAMAGRADLLVDLEAPLQLRLVELAGEAAERPVLAPDGVLPAAFIGSPGWQGRAGESQRPEEGNRCCAPHGLRSLHGRAPRQTLFGASL